MAGVILVIIFLVALVVLVIWLIIKSTRLKTVSGREGMIGKTGHAVDDFLKGNGQVRIHGEIWQAESRESILKGDHVEVTGLDNLVLTVRKKD